MKKKAPKSKRGSQWNKDGAGRQSLRSKTWSRQDDRDPKRIRHIANGLIAMVFKTQTSGRKDVWDARQCVKELINRYQEVR